MSLWSTIRTKSQPGFEEWHLPFESYTGEGMEEGESIEHFFVSLSRTNSNNDIGRV